ncbi:triose-phosphate isomerase [candidate division WOR-1 bacterium RIFOXYA12_FULL_52_29]|uniref:Triosephosphate isomerase n=1 Tax=candidate division WOR-1 bacterium RIFOXYC12_FULL_54_18 TaxID=1802584 RepID=A0A1F4T4D0_UNCSA|nr:MAG: triose-phosphate isomerase [candidate division WOR-1 bacterium RIFOXYA2_FULL_51_19]OGC17131.1 MAG: triose-phosphate isomerase [candidate division WOR-1 bacterium RIFOXYA12_FULL_52_29]OGC25991.1 MAG: triose-phosphate isomerase [candidate division WOR-1 bacterium RIFOXYB2_FULL_45_9]OGC27548.1 MAG: triose-phosphate isomerase [candidate division WOR-1 bacterium RIFOXYC12_FULL_54_18]OGC29239.1 MAG: triose-phosphate isomerase [candidate division WOR-1 bacterium RIFOXYB12_FULL_52_16]
MRKPLLAGNWKMNTISQESVKLAIDLKNLVAEVNDRDILVCPPFTAISQVADTLRDSVVMVGGQDMFWEDKGAFTGEVSGGMLKSVGATYVIIGHSERRQFFGETDATVNKKLNAAHKHGLLPIVCVGETLAEREGNKTLQVIETQIKGSLNGLPKEQMGKTVVAYEPVWAIGTGKTASPEQAQEVHAFIRKLIVELFDQATADEVRILYGGSVTPDNIKILMSQADIDGGLVGGASLKADNFAKIVKY